MPRQPDPIRQSFQKIPKSNNLKCDQVKCLHCGQLCADNATSMKRHINQVCPSITRGTGLLPSNQVLPDSSTLSDDDDNDDNDKTLRLSTKRKRPPLQIKGPRTPSWCDSMTPEYKKECNELLARAIHRTGEPFSLFENKHWQAFLTKLRPSYQPPGRNVIGGRLLDNEYTVVQSDTVRRINKFQTICLTLDGATNQAGKQVLNMMAAGPEAFFLEHFQMNLQRESAANLLAKLEDSKRRLSTSLGLEQQPVLGNESTVMWNLCTDSPNVMRSLRNKALSTNEFVFAFGCSSHALHNLCMDWVKVPSIKSILSTNVYIVVKISAVHLLSTMYDVVCQQKLGKKLVPILFTKTRWCTCYLMLRRNLLVKNVLTSMPYMIDHEDAYQDVVMDQGLRDSILDISHWKKTEALEVLLKPLCTAITYLEGDEATFSTVYACFLSLSHHVLTIPDAILQTLNVERDVLLQHISTRFKTISSPAHALAFVTDPLFYDMRKKLAELHGNQFLTLDCGSLIQQCYAALERIARENAKLKTELQEQFSTFLYMRMVGTHMYISRDFKPAHVWASVDDPEFSTLAPWLVKVHSNPAGAVGGERNHKTNNKVHNKQRVRLGHGTCQKQVAIMYNSAQLERVLRKKRTDIFVQQVATTGSNSEQEGSDQEPGEEAMEDEEDEFQLFDNNPTTVLDQYLGGN